MNAIKPSDLFNEEKSTSQVEKYVDKINERLTSSRDLIYKRGWISCGIPEEVDNYVVDRVMKLYSQSGWIVEKQYDQKINGYYLVFRLKSKTRV